MQLEESVTLFDDNKVENRFAELQITADGITSEVSRKVGNDEVISRINQTAESVKIQADKINIDGVITAVNDNTTTTIDGDKITTGTLSANAVDASSGTFDTANIPNLNANKITAGTLSADRIGVGSLSVGKIDATSGTFNTANIPSLSAEKITSGTLDAARIGASSIGADKIKVDEIQIGAAQIVSGTIDTARIPNLSATKITSDTLDGARVNAMGASGGARATLTSTGLDIYNSSNEKKASYGTTQYIYGGNGTYPYVGVNGFGAGIYQSNTQKAIMTSAGLLVYSGDATDSVASFGATARVGKLGQKNIQITNTNFNVYDDDGSIPFQVSTSTSTKTEQYGIAWYIGASSSYQTQAYFKGAIVNNTVSVGVATSGVPTASNTITLTNLGTEYTITVSGVKYTFTRYTDSVFYKIENTNSAKRSCLVSFTQSYRETYVKENTHIFDTRYQTVSVEDVTGVCNGVTLYTYAGVAQLNMRVYHGSTSVSNGGLIYRGTLGGYAPIYDCFMIGHLNGVYPVSGKISAEGTILIYNTSGASRTVNSSNMATLSATYLLAQ